MIALAILSQFTLGYYDAYGVSLEFGDNWGSDASLEYFEEYFDFPEDWYLDETELTFWQRGGIAFVRHSMQGKGFFPYPRILRVK